MRLDNVIKNAVPRLLGCSDSALLDVEILLSETINVSRAYLIAHPEFELDKITIKSFEKKLQRRLNGEPISYITGTREFWSHNFFVNNTTLIPRPETELLVELALQKVPFNSDWNILDLGTGSGAIGISIASERLACNITATDICLDALRIAKKNGELANLTNIEFIAGSWSMPVKNRSFNLIVSNPPYISEEDDALKNLQYEPKKALISGVDGLDDIRILARDCSDLLTQNGWLMVEHGASQEESVKNIFTNESWKDICCHNDLTGYPRVTVARYSGK
jgi:release factor glutamine methyltransferase